MSDIAKVSDLLTKKTPMVALLAPSFPVMYDYPQIIARLRKLGFTSVVEVSAGAKKTNEAVYAIYHDDPKGRFITSPCPGFVRMVRSQYPKFIPYLAFKADSPMIASARIAKEKYPESEIVFLGPCLAKKLEASEDYPELNITVLTFKELDELFEKFSIPKDLDAAGAAFDIASKETRVYPMDGGLTDTSGVRQLLKEEEIRIVSGYKNIQSALEEFESNPKIRLLDILFCEEGCINGPGMVSTLSLEERCQKVLSYSKSACISLDSCLTRPIGMKDD